MPKEVKKAVKAEKSVVVKCIQCKGKLTSKKDLKTKIMSYRGKK